MSDSVMVDIETLGLGPKAVTLSVAVLEFSAATQEPGRSALWVMPPIEEQMAKGRVISASTLGWWLASEEKRNMLAKILRSEAKDTFIGSIDQFRDDRQYDAVWVNGLSFDAPILESLHEDFRIGTLWGKRYWVQRDLRTAMQLAGVRKDDAPWVATHDPLDDCRRQLALLRLCMERLR